MLHVTVPTSLRRRALAVVTATLTLTVAPMLPTTAEPSPVAPENRSVRLAGVDSRARSEAGSVPFDDRLRVAALSAPITVGDSAVVGVNLGGRHRGQRRRRRAGAHPQ